MNNPISTSISKIDHYAVIGNPVAHSQSPFIHQAFAEQTDQHLQYERLFSPLDQFTETIKQFQASGGKGANVTLPFKTQAFALAQTCSLAAKQAHAANTLLFHADGSIYADNTDGVGLINDLTKNLSLILKDKTILILGAGGATSGIIAPLLAQKPAHIVIANRSIDKARILVEQFAKLGKINCFGLNAIPPDHYDLIINATSTSLSEQEFNLISGDFVNIQTCCYDLAYSKELTSFVRWGQKNGASQCHDGLGMLVEQAAAAFHLWRGIYPQTAPVITALIKHLRN